MTKEEALEIAGSIFEKWNDALKSLNPEKVSSLYTEDNIFLPTMLGKVEFGRDGDEEYFEHFLQKKPVGKIIQESVIPVPSGDIIVHAGLYNFEVDIEEGGRDTVEARFTFVYEIEDDGVWRIAHHHSSLKPVNI